MLLPQLTTGCDMRHAVAVKLKEGVTLGDSRSGKSFTVRNVKTALLPVIEKYGLKCREELGAGLEIRCKTWELSYTGLQMIENTRNGGAAVVTVEDRSSIFLWTPQPYGEMKTDVLNILKRSFKVDELECGQGFDFVERCEEW